MGKLLKYLLVICLVSPAAGALSMPSQFKQWQAWVEKARKNRQEKFAAPAITHSTYLSKVGDIGCIVVKGKYPRFKGGKDCDFQVKWFKAGVITLKTKNNPEAKAIALGQPVPLSKTSGLFVKAVEYGSGDQFRVFIYDLNQKNLSKKRERNFFEYNSDWLKTGKFVRAKKITTITIQRSDGSTKDLPVIGKINFTINKEPASLSIYDFSEGDYEHTKEFMLLYRDYSSGKKTYGAGRFLTVELPKAFGKMEDGGSVDVDFNYSYNPPCAVSTGFHCPLPQDIIPDQVLAGEKYTKMK